MLKIHPRRRNRLIAALASLAIAALTLAAVAIAKDAWHARYAGTTSSGSAITFRTKTVGGKHAVYRWQFAQLPVNCTDGASPATDFTTGTLSGLVKLKGTKFHFSATASDPNFDSTLTFKGRLTHRRTKAVGTIHVSGSLVPVASGSPRPCDSGVLSWTAKRK